MNSLALSGPFGLVMLADDSRVTEFREKPADLIPGVVNAGTYVLEPSALGGVDGDRAVSIEREVFPSLIGSGAPVHGFVSDAYWIDLGTPEKYLRATFDALEGKVGGLEYVAPFMAMAVRRANRKDLSLLKQRLEPG